MCSGLFQNVFNKMCLELILLIYMYKNGLALNDLLYVIKSNQSKPNRTFKSNDISQYFSAMLWCPAGKMLLEYLLASKSSKRVSFMISLTLGENITYIWRCFSRFGTAGGSRRYGQRNCLGEAPTICTATILDSSRAPSEAYTTEFSFWLTDWFSGPEESIHFGRSLASKNVINMTLTFDFPVKLTSVTATSGTSTGGSSTWFPDHTQNSMSHHQ